MSNRILVEDQIESAALPVEQSIPVYLSSHRQTPLLRHLPRPLQLSGQEPAEGKFVTNFIFISYGNMCGLVVHEKGKLTFTTIMSMVPKETVTPPINAVTIKATRIGTLPCHWSWTCTTELMVSRADQLT